MFIGYQKNNCVQWTTLGAKIKPLIYANTYLHSKTKVSQKQLNQWYISIYKKKSFRKRVIYFPSCESDDVVIFTGVLDGADLSSSPLSRSFFLKVFKLWEGDQT